MSMMMGKVADKKRDGKENILAKEESGLEPHECCQTIFRLAREKRK